MILVGGMIEIVMKKIAPSGRVSEIVLVLLPGAEFQEATHSSDIRTFPNLGIRINEQTVYHNGIPVPLIRYELLTLRYLAKHPSWVLPKEQIFEAVWKADPEHCGEAVANVVYSISLAVCRSVFYSKGYRPRQLKFVSCFHFFMFAFIGV